MPAEEGPGSGRSPNSDLLDEINGQAGWFPAKKMEVIWARQIKIEQKITTLEGPETVKAGDYLCRGAAGEIWPQRGESLRQKYDATGEIDGEGWRRFAPRQDTPGVMAARMDRPFQVITSWGTLSGKTGDYVVKSYDDRNMEYPEDVWIVDQEIFAATYETVDEEQDGDD